MSFNISQPSHQSLFITVLCNGLVIGTATGFVAQGPGGQNFLLTNRHVFTGRDQYTGIIISKTCGEPTSIRVAHNSNGELGQFVEIDYPLYSDDTPLWLEHPTKSASVDVVALRIPDTESICLYPYRAEGMTHAIVEPGERVNIIGFPFGEKTGPSFAIWSTGFIASEPEMDHGGEPVFLVDCRSRPGQSGSPVIVLRGGHGAFMKVDERVANVSTIRLLGIYSGRINSDSDLGRVWKGWVISELLAAACLLR